MNRASRCYTWMSENTVLLSCLVGHLWFYIFVFSGSLVLVISLLSACSAVFLCYKTFLCITLTGLLPYFCKKFSGISCLPLLGVGLNTRYKFTTALKQTALVLALIVVWLSIFYKSCNPLFVVHVWNAIKWFHPEEIAVFRWVSEVIK